MSKKIKTNETLFDQCGTPAYIAPEVMKGSGYSGFSSDIWSSGVVLFILLYGTVPFKAGCIDELNGLIINGEYKLKDNISAGRQNNRRRDH